MAEDNKSDFDAFVKAQQKSAQDAEIDWNKERDEWLAHLDALYKKIEELLGDYVKSGQILLRYQEVQLNEEDIGTYSARRLIIKIGGGNRSRADWYAPHRHQGTCRRHRAGRLHSNHAGGQGRRTPSR